MGLFWKLVLGHAQKFKAEFWGVLVDAGHAQNIEHGNHVSKTNVSSTTFYFAVVTAPTPLAAPTLPWYSPWHETKITFGMHQVITPCNLVL